MKGNVEERAVRLGEYIIEKKTTVRDSAKVFGISKSTVHKERGARRAGSQQGGTSLKRRRGDEEKISQKDLG